MTSRARWSLAAVLNILVALVIWHVTTAPTAAGQELPSAARVRFTPIEVNSNGFLTTFMKDTKSGGCWLAVTNRGGLAVVPALPGACQ